MTVPHRSDAPFSSDALPTDRPAYRIMRKGSRYNILGPHGRVFTKYKSAAVAGPRWEELTHTPWPYNSSAYERGHRLWQLGLIEREQVGAQEISATPDAAAASDAADTAGAESGTTGTTPSEDAQPASAAPPSITLVVPLPVCALPAPSLNVVEHEHVMRALQRNPALLFTPRVQQALRDEVLYHRPLARLAQHLLSLLARYERQQRRRRPAPVDAATITRRHVAWQEQRISMAAIASLSC